MLGYILFLGIIAFASGETTEVEQCSPGFGSLPIHTYIEGCTTMPCNLQQGEDGVINIVFKAPKTIRSMKTVARVNFLVTFNYSLGEHDHTCNHLKNTYCPILKDEVVSYTLRMYIDPSFPTVGVSIEFLVEDEDLNPLWCIRARVQVVKPQNGITHKSNAPILTSLASKHHLDDTFVLKVPDSK